MQVRILPGPHARAFVGRVRASVDPGAADLCRRGGVFEVEYGAWRSPAAHLLWEQGVGGSNPPAPTRRNTDASRKIRSVIGIWPSLAGRAVRDGEVGGSNPPIPTTEFVAATVLPVAPFQ